MARLAGYSTLDWQDDVISVWSAHDGQGRWVHRRNGLSVPRQAGKSVSAILWTLTLTTVMGYKVLWTDHNYSTTCEMLSRFQKVLGRRVGDTAWGVRAFNRRLRRVNAKTAQESFEFENGAVLAFSTRTKSAALGYSFDVVVYDEAQELMPEHVQAIVPTTSSGAKHNFQALYLGTPTRAGSSAPNFLNMRNEALGDEPGADLSWLEWGVDEVGDVRDERRLYEVNPSLASGQADIDAIRSGIASMLPDELAAAQEYLGYWLPERTANAVIPKAAWDECGVPDYPAPRPDLERTCYGVKFSPDGSRVALCACVERVGRRPHVELVLEAEASRSRARLADWLAERRDRCALVLIDGRSGADELDERLRGRLPKSAHRVAQAADASRAPQTLLGAVEAGELTHLAVPGQAMLDEAVTTATKRKIGSAGGWGLDGDGCHVAEAAALALLATKVATRDPRRRQEASFG